MVPRSVADGQRAEAEAEKAQAQANQAKADAKKQALEAERQEEQAQALIAAAPVDIPNPTALAPTPFFSDRLQGIVRRAHNVAKPLVVSSSELEAKEQADLETDLAVMARLLDKALDEKLGGQPRAHTAMGIDVFFTPSSGSIRDLYLDGYGALFLLNVNFPLLASSSAKAAEEKPPTDSAWEEAKQELYGEPEPKAHPAIGVPYSEEKVNDLKDALLDALKNASHIRGLKPDDSITVCVFGGPSAPPVKVRTAGTRRLAAPAKERDETATTRTWDSRTGASVTTSTDPATGAKTMQIWDARSGQTRGTVMTIRVKKSDADAFAKGNLTLDEFRKKARISNYAADIGGAGAGFSYSVGNADGFGGGGAMQGR